MSTIKSVSKAGSARHNPDDEDYDEPFWTQTEECAGFVIHDKNCHLR